MSISYIKNEVDKNHFRSLSYNVKEALSNLHSNRIRYAQFKAIIFPIIFILLYLTSTLFYDNKALFIFLYGLMGITMVLVFLNLVHNAVHDAIFKSRKLNKVFLCFFDIIGGNSYIWKKRHKFLHHRFQNIAGWDSDIEQAGLFKIYPHEKKTIFHRYQATLVFIFYPIFLLNWLLVRDFKDFFNKKQLVRKVGDIPQIEYIKLFLFKVFYVSYIIIIPILNGVPFINTIIAFLVMLIVAGLFALLVLLTPHINLVNEFPIPNKNGQINSSWLRHQFATTNDISINNWISRNIMGNFNFHLAHHLFPKLNSCFAPEVTEEIKKYASEHNLEYKSMNLYDAFQSHFGLIKNNAEN